MQSQTKMLGSEVSDNLHIIQKLGFWREKRQKRQQNRYSFSVVWYHIYSDRIWYECMLVTVVPNVCCPFRDSCLRIIWFNLHLDTTVTNLPWAVNCYSTAKIKSIQLRNKILLMPNYFSTTDSNFFSLPSSSFFFENYSSVFLEATKHVIVGKQRLMKTSTLELDLIGGCHSYSD